MLKVDIEGAEIDMFNSTDDKVLKKINQITVEFHDFKKKDDKPVVRLINKRLASLGFIPVAYSKPSHEYYDMFFVNKDLLNAYEILLIYFLRFFLKIRYFLIYAYRRFMKIIEKMSN